MANPRTALIVDDMEDMRALLKTMLLKLGFESVEEANNGSQALELYRQKYFDMVFLDISMPEISGLELLGQITRRDPDAYVIMVSGESSINNVRASIGFGAKGFVAKPYTIEKIEETIQRYS